MLALVGVQSSLDERERERLAYLADVPGVLSPLHDPPAALRTWTPSAGALVAEDSDRPLGHRRPVPPRRRRPARHRPGHRRRPVVRALLARRRPAARRPLRVPLGLGALHHDDLPRRPPGGLRRGGLPGARRRCRHPAARARPGLRQDAGDPQPGGRCAVVGDGAHLVVATPQRDAAGAVRWVLAATDPATGDVQWHRRTPSCPRCTRCASATGDPLPGRPDQRRRPGAPHRQRARVAVRRRRGAARRRDRRDRRLGRAGRAGTLVWTPWQAFAVPAGVLVTRDGTRTAVGERPARLAVDDGSAPDVVLLSERSGGEAPRTHARRSGRHLRRGALAPHRHHRRGPARRRCRARRARPTGSAPSTPGRARPAGSRRRAPPVYLGTDGSLVVVVTADRTLRGLDRADGQLASVADVARHLARDPGGVDQVSEYAGRLLVRFRDGTGIVVVG